MSQHQKPARVKVIDGGASRQARSRRDDPADLVEVVAPARATPPSSRGGRAGLLIPALFVLAAAGAGVAATFAGLA